jgi:hypothetical protein
VSTDKPIWRKEVVSTAVTAPFAGLGALTPAGCVNADSPICKKLGAWFGNVGLYGFRGGEYVNNFSENG